MKKIILASMTFILIMSCNNNTKKTTEETKVIAGGYVEDDPQKMADVPMLVSEQMVSYRAGAKSRGNADSDKDGVMDKFDKCPATPIGVKVNIYGCPTTTPPPQDTIVYDHDRDGVMDSVDKCPIDPGPSSNNGCPVIVQPPPPTSASSYIIANLPTPKNQLDGACVAFTGWALISKKNYPDSMSIPYIYNQTVFDFGYGGSLCGNGTSMQTVLNLLVNKGDCKWASWPYNGDCSVKPTDGQNLEAAGYRIPGYSRISVIDRTTIKAVISSDRLVMFAYLADDQFIAAKAGFVWTTDLTGTLPHCSAIVGFDDNKDCGDGSKGAFKILQSWGTGWCDGGFSWISYKLWDSGTMLAGNGSCYTINN